MQRLSTKRLKIWVCVHIEQIGAVKAFEAAEAYYAGRVTLQEPDYLATCAEYSDDQSQNFVLCVV